MTRETEFVQRVERQYVGEDCIQIMVQYQNSITIIGDTGIQFHYKDDSNYYVNAYLQDERRKQFPYSNIPTHYSKKHLFGKISHANQLYNFDQPYLKIGNGIVVESYAVRDNDEALLINKILPFNKNVTYKNREELMQLFSSKNDNGKTYILYPNGGVNQSSLEQIIPSEDTIKREIEELFRINVEEFENYRDEEPTSIVGNYLLRNPNFLRFVTQSIDQLDLSKYKLNFHIGNYDYILVIHVNNGEITIKGYNIYFISSNQYKVEEYNIPVTKYTLEQLKYVSHICRTREPKIPLNLNPGVTKEDITEAKKLVKELKKC